MRVGVVLLAAGYPPDPLATEAASALPTGAELVTFLGGDHDLHAQRPSQVASIIRRLA